jgi:hypothetical protein
MPFEKRSGVLSIAHSAGTRACQRLRAHSY